MVPGDVRVAPVGWVAGEAGVVVVVVVVVLALVVDADAEVVVAGEVGAGVVLGSGSTALDVAVPLCA